MNTQTEPSIGSIKDFKDDLISRNSSAISLMLTFEGDAQALSTINLFDGEIQLEPPVSVSADGSWRSTLFNVSLGEHEFTVRGLDGARISDPWLLTVTEPHGDTGIVQWDTFPLGPLPADQDIDCGYGTTLLVTGDGASIAPNAVPGSNDHALKPAENCKLRFDFHGDVQRLWILHSGARPLHNLFRFYDAQNNVVKGVSLESPEDLTKVTFLSIDPFCTYFDATFVANVSGTLIDALVWEHGEFGPL